MAAQDFYIMVVDDEDSICSILYETLTSEGYNVVTAASGEEALKLLQEKDLPHIIMTDIRMLGMDGVELAMRAKEISDEIEVIIMTSYASLETATQAIKIGVYDYISKPFIDLAEVKTLILRVIDKIYLRQENKQLMEQLKVKNIELTDVNEEISAIYRFGKELLVLLNPDEIITTFLSYMSSLLNGTLCVFLKYYPAKTALVVRQLDGKDVKNYTKEQLNEFKNVGMSLGVAGHTDIISVVSHIANHPSLKTLVSKLFKTTDYMAFPLIIRNTPIGVTLVVGDVSLDERQDKIIKQYLNQLKISYDKAMLHRKIKDLAIRDGLTGLYNHRYFQEKLHLETQTTKRIKHPLSIIFFDIDHFKNYNDVNGHPMGDMLLRGIASILKKSFRSTDVLCRYGGEEFCIILPHTDLEGALIKAEQLRKAVEETQFQNQDKQPNGNLTISIGVSEIPTHSDDAGMIIQVADDALYKVKEGGRNRVAVAEPYSGYVPSYESKKIPTGHEVESPGT